MSFKKMFQHIDRVAAHLPFALHDSERVNEAFATWRSERDESARRNLDIWTYCFARRYLLLKFAAERSAPTADFELVVERAYRKIEAKRLDVVDDNRYAGWVSIVCKNTYYNYLRTATRTILMEEGDEVCVVAEPTEYGYDATLLLDELHRAIDALPPYLVEVGRLKFLHDRPYEDIADVTGLELPIVRSYASKVAARLRRDPRLIQVLEPIFKKMEAN